MLKNETALEKLTNENLAIAQKITEIVIEITQIIEVARVELQKKTEEMQQLLKEQIEEEEKAEKSGDRNEVQRIAQAKALEEQIQASQKLQQELEKTQERIRNQIALTRKALKNAETTLDKTKQALSTATEAVILAGSKLGTATQNKQNALSRESRAEANLKATDIALSKAGKQYKAAQNEFKHAAGYSTLSATELKELFSQLATASGATANQLELKIVTSFNSNHLRPTFEALRLYQGCKAEYNKLNSATQVLDAAKANHDVSRIERDAARKNRASCNVAEIAARVDLKLAKREENIAQLLVEKNQEIVNTLNANLNQLNQEIANLTLDMQNATQQTARARTQLSQRATPIPFASIPATSMAGTTKYACGLTKNGLQFQPNSFILYDIKGDISTPSPKLCIYIERVEKALFNKFLKENGYTLNTNGINKNGNPIDDKTFDQIQKDYAEYRNADSLTKMANSMSKEFGGNSLKFFPTPKPGVAKIEEQEKRYEETATTSYASRAMRPAPSGQT